MKRLLTGFLLFAALAWIAVGPRPADNTPYQKTGYYQRTLQELASSSLLQSSGQLSVGVAEVDITPPAGHPLAGFGGRRPKDNQGVESRCFARALTLAVNGEAVTILTADMLLANRALVDAVLSRTGLSPNQLYITASHTHSGPGGYAEGLIYELVFGDYDPAYFERLADQLSVVIRESRDRLKPAEFAHIAKELPGRQQNRIDDQAPTHDPLSLLLFRPAEGDQTKPLAILSVFGAHATVLGTGNRLVSADYPGRLAERLKQQTGAGMVLFAAGAVGDARPFRLQGSDDYQRAGNYGMALADAIIPDIGTARWQRAVSLASLNLAVDLPEVRIPMGVGWSLGPLLTRLVADRKGRVATLRIGDLLLAGFPADYSGHLATVLSREVDALADRPLTTVATSFSGGYKGYLVSSHWFYRDAGYETRDVNFFGPWAGDYFNELVLGMAKRLF